MKLDSMDATFYGAVAVLVTVVLFLFGSGVFRGDGASVTSWNTFVFGEGPWVVWHVFLLASLLAFGDTCPFNCSCLSPHDQLGARRKDHRGGVRGNGITRG